MHAIHQNLPGFDARHVLHDGCETCEERAAQGIDGLLRLDHGNTLSLWSMMLAREYGTGLDFEPSAADDRAMRTLYALSVFLERAGLSAEDMQVRLTEKHRELSALWGSS